MIHYNIWFNFRRDVAEKNGLEAIRYYLGDLKASDGIAGFRLLRNSGQHPKTTMLPYQAVILFRDEAQFSAAFNAQASKGIRSGLHGNVMSQVDDFRIEIFREIPAEAG